MIPLHKASRGLLELLRARTLGRNPDVLSSTVMPSIESTGFYGADLQVVATQVSAAGAMTRTLDGVAANMGRLFSASATIVVGAAAGTQIRLEFLYRPSAAFSFIPLASTVITAPVAAAVYRCAVLLPEPLIFLPGAEFRAGSAGDAAGADHVLQRAEFFENYAI